jgi:preprotein translocase subunit SecA
VEEAYEAKCKSEDQEVLPFMERGVFLQVIDREWQDYLRAMDDLRQGVNLRSYGQRDPLIEYKKEAFGMFETLMNTVKSKVVSSEFRSATAMRMQRLMHQRMPRMVATDANTPASPEPEQQPSAPSKPKTVADILGIQAQTISMKPKTQAAVGRNDPCPCGSGKKYKKCCGKGA